jgi:aspartyl-tRNA(Asn)/glutamyl-tRNA(Gln) amidotransferase subunit A
MKINELTISQAVKGLKKKQFSSLELTRACLGRIKAVDNKINAFISVCQSEALADAGRADREIKVAKDLSDLFRKRPLLGVPAAVKDNFCTRGIKTTAASKVLANHLAAYDATAVKRLKEAGGVVIGKTNLDAWAHGASGENSDYGPTKNPWNLKTVSGGSSSGSAVSVAAGMSLMALGSDTGGSIRMPASFCNLVGLKPTYGRVSRYGVIAMASSFDSIGHLTRDVVDSATILSITAGQDGFDATMPPRPVADYPNLINQKVKGLKVGVIKEFMAKGLNRPVKSVFEAAVKDLKKLGVKIEMVSLPHSQYAVSTYYILVPSEISSNLARYDGIRYGQSRHRFADEAIRRIMIGTYALSSGYYDAYYDKAMRVRRLIINDFEKVFEKVDAVISPTSPVLPFKLGEKTNDPLSMYLMDVYTAVANLAGLPTLSIPAGFAEKLPVGIQLIGPQFAEAGLFTIGHAYQQITDWHQKIAKV